MFRALYAMQVRLTQSFSKRENNESFEKILQKLQTTTKALAAEAGHPQFSLVQIIFVELNFHPQSWKILININSLYQK